MNDASSQTLPERVLADDRRVILLALLGIVAPCWAWIGVMSVDMYGDMHGASAWSMTLAWGWQHTAVLFAMWVAMMTGMMLPSVTPVVLLYARVVRADSQVRGVSTHVAALTAGYLAAWIAFSGAATLLQRLLTRQAVLTPMMEVQSGWLVGLLLVAAGAYQLTPLKSGCLKGCRSAAGVVTGYWRRGPLGAFRMGAHHGAYCLGCCWALMLLLFAGGVMNPAVVAGVTGLVLLEKIMPEGLQLARVAGALMLGAGAWMVLS